jgi:tyrosine-protein kinase Etk/Wzc
MKLENTQQNNTSEASNQQDIDWLKMAVVFRKSYLWILLIFILCFSIAFLVIRYTKPLYESSSEIKLGIENQSNVLNMPEFESNNSYAFMSSEMELIRSRLFFNKVVESVRLNPQYFTYGQILDDEKFRNPPFTVEYQLKSLDLYNTPIDVTILDTSRFVLSYKVGEEKYSSEHLFNAPIETKYISMKAEISPYWNDSMDDEHYIIIRNHDSLIDYLESNLSVEPVNFEANIFKISFQDYSLTKAHALVNAIDTLYYQYSLEEKNRANKNKIEYLNSQLAETEKKLDDYEKYFEDVTISNRTVSLDEDVRRTVTLINQLDSQKVKLADRLRDLNNLAENVKAGKIITISVVNSRLPAHIMSLIDELNLLINEREQLGLSYKENTYTYKSRQKEIELLIADLLAQIENSRKVVLDDITFLENQKLSLNTQLNQLPSKNTAYNKVKRFYSLYEEVYLSLMQSKNEFEIAIAGSTTKIKILSPASMPSNPIKPNQLLIYGIGTVLAFILAIAFVIIRYVAHNKINNINDVERLTNVTLLGSVPKFKSAINHAQIVVKEFPKSILSESMRSIRTNMEFMLPDLKTKVYSVTSTIGSEGKTFISTNLGALHAMAGKNVIILDLDLRRPKVHLAFGNEAANFGVSTLLIGKHKLEDCITKSEIPGLEYIGAGPVPPNPSELLLRTEFDQLLETLKKTYDLVILDTPPIGLVTDGLLAMQKADLPIYVLRADYSKLAFIKNINRLAATGRHANLSIILNSVSKTTGAYGYSYGDLYTESPYFQD